MKQSSCPWSCRPVVKSRTKESRLGRRQAACWLWHCAGKDLSGGTLEQAVDRGSEGAPWIVRGIRRRQCRVLR